MADDPSLRRYARRRAQQYGIDPDLFEAQIQQESGFQTGAVSPAGAQGVAQIMPATAAGWGVDPNRPRDALDAAAKHMAGYQKQFGSFRDALVAYNAGPGRVGQSLPAETQAYIKKIMGAQQSSPSQASAGGTGLVGGGIASPPPASPNIFSTMAKLTPTVGDSGFNEVLRQGWETLAAMRDRRTQAQQPILPSVGASSFLGSLPPAQGGGGVSIRPGADRGGVGTKPYVMDFARQISAIAGQKIEIGTGTNHSQMTVNGNVSDHWSGDAADIPAAGKQLIHLGQSALIAAGMDPAEARRQTGGLYNINGAQIIFNTQEGGDHTDHLHINPPNKRRR